MYTMIYIYIYIYIYNIYMYIYESSLYHYRANNCNQPKYSSEGKNAEL